MDKKKSKNPTLKESWGTRLGLARKQDSPKEPFGSTANYRRLPESTEGVGPFKDHLKFSHTKAMMHGVFEQ